MRQRVIRSAVLVLVVGLSGPGAARAAVADDLATIEKTLSACLAKDNSNAGMRTCSSDADADADAILNRVYAAGAAKLKGAGADADSKEILDRLVASERAWIAYRDADCSLEGASMLGGTGESLTIVDCHYTMTKRRVQALDDFFKDR